MNWLDSSSFTGLLSQAQKSIDKVLDISSEDASKSKKSGQSSEPDISPTLQDKEKNSSGEKSSSGWLSGADSFWGSLTQNVSNSSKNETNENYEKSLDNGETQNKEKANSVPQKESKLSTNKARNVKRNIRTKSVKKELDASDSSFNEVLPIKGAQEEGTRTKNLNAKDVTSEETEKQKDIDFTDAKLDVVSKDKISDDDIVIKKSSKNSGHEMNVNENWSEKEEKILEATEDTVIAGNFETVNETVKKVVVVNENKMNEQAEKVEELENERKHKNDEVFDNIDLENAEVDNQSSKEIDMERDDNESYNMHGIEENLENEDVDPKRQALEEIPENLDLLMTTPVAASTPARRKEPQYYNSDDNDKLKNFDLLKASESRVNAEQELEKEVESETIKDSNVDHETQRMPDEIKKADLEEQGNELTSKETERLHQIIEVREAKLVELSKENLNLQETNAILRSQIEQLDEMHKSEDAELEQMKDEFTKRIGESEAKLQTAAKERDLFKKELEETQKCLSSDMERQLKDFQSLSKEKDEQIAQLMEEGEKLSKQILQRNNNIKKLRAKEKELNTSNESLSTRLEAAESEVERLTGILKERDEHEKEQDDAIKKLNAYIKKQEDLVAKQKVELEESAAKLPSLQTALDNAYKEISELHKVNAAKSNEVQEATLSVEMTAKEELRIALEKLKKESQKECDILAMEVTDLQTQLSRSEQQAARREDNLRQEIADIQMRLQEAETRNQELTQSVSVATRPLLRQIENLQHSYGSQQTSWEKLEKNLTERLADAQSQLATAQEKERASTERAIELGSKVTSLELQVATYRQEKSRIEAEFELERSKLEVLEEFKSRESGKIEALKTMHTKQLETMMVEKSLLEQQLVVERTKYESEQKKLSKLEEQLKEKSQKSENFGEAENEDSASHITLERRRSRNSSSSSVFPLSDTITRSLPSGGTAVLEELQATIRHKEGELASMQSTISTLESSRESLTKELTSIMNTNENLVKENKQLHHVGNSFKELQTKYNALLQMYGEKEEETEELKLDLQDIKNMYKTQIQELLSGR